MRYGCLLVSVTLLLQLPAVLHAQDGAAIYNQRCATCHNNPAPHVPPLSAIKAMSGAAIYTALTRGIMKTQADGLSTAQLIALIRYIAPARSGPAPELTRTCKSQPAFPTGTNTPQWNGWSPSITNSRFQNARSARITAADLNRLKLKWAFNLGDVSEARSQPSVIGRYLFIGSNTGAFYALDVDSGCTLWGFRAESGIRGGADVGRAGGVPAVFFSDAGGNVYAVNAQTGELVWKVRPVNFPAALATAAPRFYDGVLYEAFSSYEELLGAEPKYECCKFRGSVVALNASDGSKLWQSFTIPEAPRATKMSPAGTQQYGPSGAAVWSTPTIDRKRNVLYVATGDNYSDPPTNTSDAVLAMDLKTGKLLWSTQLTKDDAFNDACGNPAPGNCPATSGHDYDFGQPPILIALRNSRRVLVIAQKSGLAYGLDPDAKGKVLWQRRIGNGGPFGGSQWGSASDGAKVYVAVSDLSVGAVRDSKSSSGYRLVLDPKKGGGLYALNAATGKVIWSAPPIDCAPSRTDCSPAQSAAVTAIPGLVFSGSVDGHLRAYSTKTGKVLWDTDTAHAFPTVNGPPARGGSMDAAGATVVNGMLFVNSGYGQWGGNSGNVLLAFSVH